LEEKKAEGYSYTNNTGELIGIAYHEWVLVYRPRNAVPSFSMGVHVVTVDPWPSGGLVMSPGAPHVAVGSQERHISTSETSGVTMKRWIKFTIMLLSLAGCYFIVWKVVLLGSTFGRRGSHEHFLNTTGMRTLFVVLTSYQLENTTNPITSFNQFFNLIQTECPDAKGKADAPNPFPGILPSGHTYARLLKMPDGLDPKTTPLIWDRKPGYEGFFAGLSWDGSMLKGIDTNQLSQILDVVKRHGGVIYSGNAAPTTTPPPASHPLTNAPPPVDDK
jgi:hypothetical protein